MDDFILCMIIIDLLITIFLHFDLKTDIERKIDEAIGSKSKENK